MKFIYDDGGRKLAGRKGDTGDCVTRAVAIATGLPYAEVYDSVAKGNGTQRRSMRDTKASSHTASRGINVRRKWFKDYMVALGWKWTPTMSIGTGCKVHLRTDELPTGRLIVSVSKHYTSIIDGVIHDTYDPQREEEWLEPDCGQELQKNQRRLGPYDPTKQNTVGGGHGIATTRGRCVYGYWSLAKVTP